jgi:predicted metal-dependent peptidase
LVALDISGSRKIEPNYLFSLLQKFMARQVVLFTTQIDGVLAPTDLATPEALKLDLHKIYIQGGTDVQPVIDYFKQYKFDHLVVITDGYLNRPQGLLPEQATWVIDEVVDRPPDYSFLPEKVIIGV